MAIMGSCDKKVEGYLGEVGLIPFLGEVIQVFKRYPGKCAERERIPWASQMIV